MHPFEKCAMKAAILHHGLNTLNYNFLTFVLDRKVNCLHQHLFNAIALAIVSKFVANNRPESIEPVPINTIISRSLPVIRFAVTYNNISFICHIAESTELKGYKLQLKKLLL